MRVHPHCSPNSEEREEGGEEGEDGERVRSKEGESREEVRRG